MNNNTKNVISERLSDLLEMKTKELSIEQGVKITQGKIADLIGIKQSSLSKYLNAVAEPTASQLIALSKFFNVSTDYILGLEKNPSPDPELRAVCKYTHLSEVAIENIRKMTGSIFTFSQDNRFYWTDITEASVINAIVTNLGHAFSDKMLSIVQGSINLLPDEKEFVFHQPEYDFQYWALSKELDQILQNSIVQLEEEIISSIKRKDFESVLAPEFVKRATSRFDIEMAARKAQVAELKKLSVTLIGIDESFEKWWKTTSKAAHKKLENGEITLDEFEKMLTNQEWEDSLYKSNPRVKFCWDIIREGFEDEKEKV